MKASNTSRILAVNELGERTPAFPAVAAGAIFICSGSHLFKFSLSKEACVLPRSSALFGCAIRGWGGFKQAFEMLAEAGDVAVADAFGDSGDR